MNKAYLLLYSYWLTCSLTFATPTESREWEATSGHKITAVATEIKDDQVVLKKGDGKIIKVPLDKFVDADQELLNKHFQLSTEPVITEGSGAKTAEGLAHPLGEITGPVAAGGGSNYHIYLPQSLKKDRKAPMLFLTNAGGGLASQLKPLVKYAETFGWILAISVESKNTAGWESNTKNCTNCLKHILKNIPIDKNRIHYTGNSGGGAMAFMNTEIQKAYGVMPNIAYIPNGVSVRAKVVYALGGGHDYNRYYTAYAAQKFKENGFHRLHKKGHSHPPDYFRGDGMFWMHCKFLKEEKDNHDDEVKDFEPATLKWLTQLKNKQPKRAYSNARFFKEIYEPSGNNAKVLDSLIKELEKSEDNKLYHAGLIAIDEHSDKHFAPLGKKGGSHENHVSEKSIKAAEKLQEVYGHIPEINDILTAIKKKTDKY